MANNLAHYAKSSLVARLINWSDNCSYRLNNCISAMFNNLSKFITENHAFTLGAASLSKNPGEDKLSNFLAWSWLACNHS